MKPTRRRGYAWVGGRQIHYRQALYGSAILNPLLCLHDTPLSGRMFEPVLPLLGEERHTLAPDLSGYGDSDLPASPPTIDDYAFGVASFMAELEVGRYDILGVGTGAAVAVELAIRLPDRVGKLVLIAPSCADSEPVCQGAGPSQPLHVDAAGDYLVGLWKKFRANSTPELSLDEFAGLYPDVTRRPGASWWGQQAALQYPLMEHLRRVTQPTRLLDSGNAWLQQAVALPAHIELVTLPDVRPGFLNVHAENVVGLARSFTNPATRGGA